MTLVRLKNFNVRDILHNKRIAVIQKARTPLQVKIQMINNEAIDERILTYFDDYDIDNPTIPAYKEEVIRQSIGQTNLMASYADLNRLLQKSRLVTPDHITKMEQYNAASRIGNKITNVEIERIQKNLEYVEQTLKEAELDLAKYKEIVNKVPRTVSRKDILEKALTSGQNYKGREYSYKELNNLSRDLERYRLSSADFEAAKIENEQSQRNGNGSLNQTKTWIWSQLERTRHSGMDGETVGLYEKFTVVNEVTDVVDYLRFPHDIENDNNNCSNICNCQCSYEINTN